MPSFFVPHKFVDHNEFQSERRCIHRITFWVIKVFVVTYYYTVPPLQTSKEQEDD